MMIQIIRFGVDLSELSGDLDCLWMTGESCDCTDILETTSFFVRLFIDMGKDNLIENILSLI